MSGHADKVPPFFKGISLDSSISFNPRNGFLIYHKLFEKKDIGVEKGPALFFKEQVILLVTLVVSPWWSPQKVGTISVDRAKRGQPAARAGPNPAKEVGTLGKPAQEVGMLHNRGRPAQRGRHVP